VAERAPAKKANRLTPPRGASARTLAQKSCPALVYAGMLQARDLVLHLQLAALKLGDLQIVGGGMRLSFTNFLL
jgi:hypothetical protein